MEVEFEPMGMNGPSPEELMGMLSGGEGPRGMTFAASGPDMGSLFNDMVRSMQIPRRGSRQHRGRAHMSNGDDFGGMLSDSDGFGPMLIDAGSSMPVSEFHDLFPGPMGMAADPEEVELMGPLGGPDLMVGDMLRHVNRMFKTGMLPAIHRMSSKQRKRAACQDDVQRLCNGTQRQLHCLGQHASEISEDCRKAVGKSVPFLCNKAISQHCDALDRGLLPCLADRLQELDGSCRDAVVATHRVIAKVNTQKATVQDPATGEKVVHTPTAPATEWRQETSPTSSQRPVPPAQREVQLDKIIASAPTKAPLGMQDRAQSTSTRKPVAPVFAEPHVVATATHVDRSPPTLPATNPVLAATNQAPPAPQGQAGHSVSGVLQAVVLLGLICGCVYMLKSQVGNKSRCVSKGALLELNTNTPDHML